MALVHAGLGEREQAFEWLSRAYTARDVHLIFLPVDPKWAATDPTPDSRPCSRAVASRDQRSSFVETVSDGCLRQHAGEQSVNNLTPNTPISNIDIGIELRLSALQTRLNLIIGEDIGFYQRQGLTSPCSGRSSIYRNPVFPAGSDIGHLRC